MLAARELLDIGGHRVDRCVVAAPVIGKHGLGGLHEIGANVVHGCREAERPQRVEEDFGGQVLGVGRVTDAAKHVLVDPNDVVAIDLLPV
jgi:hypothetical protein